MDKAAGEGAGSGGSSRSSSRATSAGSSPSGSWAARGAGGRRLEGGSHSSPGSVAASPCGAAGRRREPALEGVLSKYTNLLQGWQNRYFMLDFESGILQYFVNEQSKNQKPRGALSLAGAIVSLSDEAPHMLVVHSANGEVYKLRAADAKEKQCWVTQLQNCAKYHMETSKSPPSSRSRSLTLLPHGTSNSSSPSSQRHLTPAPPTVVTVTHHKSPAAARRSKSHYSAQLHDVREMMSQVEGQQKTLVRAIEALPCSGPLTALDQDLLLLKATSAATLSCLGECLSLLQQSIHQVGQYSHRTGPSENLAWRGPKSHSTDQLRNGAVGLWPSSSTSVTWAALPDSAGSEDVRPKPEPKDGEKKKKKAKRWKRNVEEDVSSWPLGEEDVCSVPVYRDNVCPMEVHKEDVYPVPVCGKDLCLMQVSVEDVCPTVAVEKDVSPLPVVDENKTPMPAVDKDKSPMPAVDKDKSLMLVVDKGKTPMPAVDKGKTPMPAVDKDKSPMPAVDKDKSLMLVVDKGKTPMPAVDGNKTLMPVVDKDKSLMLVVDQDKTLMPAVDKDKSPMPAVDKGKTPMPAVDKGKSLMLVDKDKSLMPAVDRNKTLMPVVDKDKSLMLVVDQDKTLMPAVDKDKSLMLVVDKGKTPMPAVDKGKTPRPAVDKGKTPMPAVDGNKTLMPAVDKDKSPMPVDKGKTPMSAVDKDKSLMLVDKDKSLMPAVDGNKTLMPVVDKDKSLMLVVDQDKTLMPAVDKDKSPLLVVDKGKTPMPAVDNGKTPRPAVDKDKSLMPAVEKDMTLMPAVDRGKTQMSAVDKGKTLRPAVDRGKTPRPAVDKGKTPRPAVDKGKTPRPAVDKDKTPRPVAEEKVEGAKEILSARSQAWSAHQLPAEHTSTSQHHIRPSPSVIQQEPKVESPLGTTLQEIRINEEETDSDENGEDMPRQPEDHHNVVVHLISQLRFGMDLTKVALPTFILEKRSLLEMFANFMAHPDMLLSIGSGATPADRAISFVEYYLTSFREGRKGAVAKKPYNPILGETFHCSWDIPKDRVKPLPRKRKAKAQEASEPRSGRYKLTFVAEQVSHHPPVSCFYCECKEKGMFVNTYVWTKSKFMGMSIGVSLVGEGVLRLLDYGEDYVFTLPSAYARSILTIPWVELGGKVTMDCAKTGYTALVTFHTKPFYGGKIHRVTAEVKHKPTNTIVCKAQGEWNGILEFTYSNGETKLVNTASLPVYPKKVRPLEKQGSMESRNLWRQVTDAIKLGDMSSATEFKQHLEDRQRKEEQQRAAVSREWQPKYFIKQGEGWMYVEPLLKVQ